uniref:Golgin subfamily A member 5 n=1 Tax=Lygus hesperus TaxID=30085 RepID=A0A0A9W378_LYGHE
MNNMNQSLSCNSLTVYHYVTPSSTAVRGKSAAKKCSKKLSLASRTAASTRSEFKLSPREIKKSGRRRSRTHVEPISGKTVISSHWTSCYDYVSVSAPTSNRELDRNSSCVSAITHTEQLVPEREQSAREVQTPKEDFGQNLLQQLEQLKDELKQCKEASQFSESQAFALSDELANVRSSLTAEKERLTRQLHTYSKTIHDQKATLKNLTENNDRKDCIISTLKNNMAKSEASNASRAATIKSLKREIVEQRKALTESSRSEGIAQQCNKDLLAENKKLKGILEDMKTSINLLQLSNSDWEDIVNHQIEVLAKEGENNHFDCRVSTSQRLGSLKASYDHRVQLLLKKLFRADRKTKQLYQTLENIIKGVHAHTFNNELRNLLKFDLNQYIAGDGDLPQSSVVLHLGDWLDTIHDLAYKKRFSSDLSKFILDLLNGDADRNEPNIDQ